MIDKAEQRRRAQEMSTQLAAQGLEAPKLTYPVKPKPVNVHLSYPFIEPPKVKKVKAPKVDCTGKQLEIGDTVVTTINGIVSALQTGRVVRFTKDRIEIKIAMRNGTHKTFLKYGDAVAKVMDDWTIAV